MRSKQAPADPVVVIEATGDPAFAVDDNGIIVAWNNAIQGLLGYPAAQVVGRRCTEVVCGRDVFGNRYCQECCPVRQTFLRNEPVNSFEMYTRGLSGEAVRVVVTSMLVRAAQSPRFLTIHVLDAIVGGGVRADLAKVDKVTSEGVSGTAGSNGKAARVAAEKCLVLTARELEILGHLASGATMKIAASDLHISVATVRTHARNILGKYGVHNLRHAISLAQGQGLI